MIVPTQKYRPGEARTVVHEGMKFSVFSTRIDTCREVGQEGFVEVAATKVLTLETVSRVSAGEPRSVQAAERTPSVSDKGSLGALEQTFPGSARGGRRPLRSSVEASRRLS